MLEHNSVVRRQTFPLFLAFIVIGCCTVPDVPEKQAAANLAPETPKQGVEKKSPEKTVLNPDEELMAQFKAFATRKRDYLKLFAKENELNLPAGVWKFFDEAIAGDFAKAGKRFGVLNQIARPSEGDQAQIPVPKKMRESAQKAMQIILEVQGAMETVDMWHAKFLHFYTKEIISNIPKGSIYFGGTDPGRFAITMGCSSHAKADPFFTITQNALADATYLHYLRELYGERIRMPTEDDNQNAFRLYLETAKKRLMANLLKPGEDVTLVMQFQCPVNPIHSSTETYGRSNAQQLAQLEKDKAMPCRQCKLAGRETMIPLPEPRVQVSGNTAVMEINANLAKTIFEKNSDHDFYLEESFPLDWMKPHMVPHGLIFKLERKPLKALPPNLIAQSRKNWQKYMKLSVGDAVVKPETTVAELCQWVEAIHIKGNRDNFKGDATFLKGKKEVLEKPAFRKGPSFSEQKFFSKLRSDQADLFAWRLANTKDEKLKNEYAKEADFAYRQAFALGSINPQVAYRYVFFLNEQKRFADAELIARTFSVIDPNYEPRILFFVFTRQEASLFGKSKFKEAAEKAREISKLEKLDPATKKQALERAQSYEKMVKQNEMRIQEFQKNPADLALFNKAVRAYYTLKKMNELAEAIDLFAKNAADNAENSTALQNAYVLVSDWKSKLKYDRQATKRNPDAYMAWFGLSVTHLKLKQIDKASKSMVKALELFDRAKDKPTDIRKLLQTDATFAPLRARPEIAKLLNNK